MQTCRVTDCTLLVYCKEICKVHYQQWFRQKPEQITKRQKYHKEHYQKNTEWYRARNKKQGKDRKKMNCYAAREREFVPERYRERSRNQYRKNPSKAFARVAKRRATKLRAIPAWADLSKILEIYSNCPKGFHVDHIVPLAGKNVCGLHVEYNLQTIPARENLKKGNKYGGE